MAVLFSTRILAITKARLLIVLSLSLTWWLSRLAPGYGPVVPAEVSSRIQEARRRMPELWPERRPGGDGPAALNASKLALLMEPRPLPHLVPLMVHMVSVVPPDWRFLFVGSQWSVHSVGRAPAIKQQRATGKVTLMTLPRPWSIGRREDVFRLLTDVRFYDEVLAGVEWVLKYEHDSILCANSPTSLDDWLGWSWAGAPRSENDRFPGIGGLTLRRVSAVKRVLAFQNRLNDSEAEDEWFCKRLSAMPGASMAPAWPNAFAVHKVPVGKPMGYHVQGGGGQGRADMWENAEARRGILEYCPELSIIMDMKLERERCPDDDLQGGRTADAAKVAGAGGEGVGLTLARPPPPPPPPPPLAPSSPQARMHAAEA
ncbi:hypothetical protein CDD83_9068 [Cordyceps sp. RAO-2017]|nr:hypothetical protein CDD83_9068 [Cordyceps sp. RAO-2017]